MTNGEAVGPDQISTEVIKALDEVRIDVLYGMLNEIYNKGIIPQESLNRFLWHYPKHQV